MAYFAVKGGTEAIENACQLLTHERTKGPSNYLTVEQIKDQLYLLVDRVMGEGSLYAPDLAALAVKQSAGDTLEASFMIRAYRTTLPRIAYSIPRTTKDIRIIRRISAAFKDIPGGQVLGPTSDYTLRLLDFDLFEEKEGASNKIIKRLMADQIRLPRNAPLPESFPKVVEILRKEGLLMAAKTRYDPIGPDAHIFDITRNALTYPAPRSAALQSMARGETGGLLALAYSSMRGYGNVHPTIGELRVGYVPVVVAHPHTKEAYCAGEVKVTEAEVIARFDKRNGKPVFTLGYGLCFGQNEIKAISMAILDRSMQAVEPKTPAEDQEFVLSHTDGIEAMGFCNHWKLPHYVDFQSDLDRLRKAQTVHDAQKVD
jgi:alpha-D-ribose 1-methylphosphonate 5-triphosphate synthase subunit PhnI